MLADARFAHPRALQELRAGSKRGHWIWHVFPVHRQHCAGSRPLAAMQNLSEAVAYLRNEELRANYFAVMQATCDAFGAAVAAAPAARAPWRVFDRAFTGRKAVGKGMKGPVDAFKVRASATLFGAAAAEAGDVEMEAACRRALSFYTDASLLNSTGKPPMVGADPDMLVAIGRAWRASEGAVAGVEEETGRGQCDGATQITSVELVSISPASSL